MKETVFSFVLAVGIVGAALWIADRSVNKNGTVQQSKWGPRDAEVGFSGRETEPRDPRLDATDTVSNVVSASQDSTAPNGISKCVINGKVVYSNGDCPDGAQRKNLVLYDTAGVVSPPKESLAELTAKRQAAERAYNISMQQRPALQPQLNKSECAELEKRVEYLDALARQPHSGQAQDQIKEEKRAVRDRQFSIHC